MKQTDNAIKHLNSSYRAVLKHAYFAGIASSFAVAATAPYAVQAAESNGADALHADQSYAVSGKHAAGDMLQSAHVSITAGKSAFAQRAQESLDLNGAYQTKDASYGGAKQTGVYSGLSAEGSLLSSDASYQNDYSIISTPGSITVDGGAQSDDASYHARGALKISASDVTLKGANAAASNRSSDGSRAKISLTDNGVLLDFTGSSAEDLILSDGDSLRSQSAGSADPSVRADDLSIISVQIRGKGRLDLAGSGRIGDITGESGSSLEIAPNSKVSVTGADGASYGKVTAASIRIGGGSALRAANVTAESARLSAGSEVRLDGVFDASNTVAEVGSSITARTVKINAGSAAGAEISGDRLDIGGMSLHTTRLSGRSVKIASSSLSGSRITGETVRLRNIAGFGGSSVRSDTLDIAGGLDADGGSRISARSISVTGGNLNLGSFGSVPSKADLRADGLDLNGNTLTLDNAVTGSAVTARVGNFKSEAISSGVEFTGDVVLGRNSALGISDEESDFNNAMRKFRNAEGGIAGGGAYAYIDKADIRLGNHRLIVGGDDPAKTLSESARGVSVHIGGNSVMEVSAKALHASAVAQKPVFSDMDGKRISSDNGTLYVPAGSGKEQIRSIFGDGARLADGSRIRVQTRNGLFTGVIDSSEDLRGTGDLDMTLSPDSRQILKDVSDETYNYLMSTLSESAAGTKAEAALASSYAAATPDASEAALSDTAPQAQVAAGGGVEALAGSNGFTFIQDAAGSNPAAIEKAARLMAYAGGAQIMNSVVKSAQDVIAERTDFTGAAGTTAAITGAQGSAAWFRPVYAKSESSDFGEEANKYGSNVKHYGLIAGFDYTMRNSLRVGTAFTYGKGDATGSGFASGIRNEFSYFGGSLYAAMRPSNTFAMYADLGYYSVDNDADSAVGVAGYGKMSAKSDSKAITAGATGIYTFNLRSFTMSPFAGVRYTKIDIDDYKVNIDGNRIATTAGGSADIFSLPVGVRFATTTRQGNWMVKPQATLRATFNTGDDSIGTRTSFEGVLGSELNYNTEFLDSVTYGADLGVDATNGNMTFGVRAGYTGSSNTDDYSINAHAAMKF